MYASWGFNVLFVWKDNTLSLPEDSSEVSLWWAASKSVVLREGTSLSPSIFWDLRLVQTPGLFQLLGLPKVGPCVILGVRLLVDVSFLRGVLAATFWELVEQLRLKTNISKDISFRKVQDWQKQFYSIFFINKSCSYLILTLPLQRDFPSLADWSCLELEWWFSFLLAIRLTSLMFIVIALKRFSKLNWATKQKYESVS